MQHMDLQYLSPCLEGTSGLKELELIWDMVYSLIQSLPFMTWLWADKCMQYIDGRTHMGARLSGQ